MILRKGLSNCFQCTLNTSFLYYLKKNIYYSQMTPQVLDEIHLLFTIDTTSTWRKSFTIHNWHHKYLMKIMLYSQLTQVLDENHVIFTLTQQVLEENHDTSA